MPCLSVAGCWIAVCQCIILWIGMWWNSLSGVYKQCFALDNISYVLDWLQSQPISTISTSLAEHCIHGCFPDVPGLAMAPWFSSSCCSKEPFGIVCRKSTYLLLVSLAPVFYRLDVLHATHPTASKHWTSAFVDTLIPEGRRRSLH